MAVKKPTGVGVKPSSYSTSTHEMGMQVTWTVPSDAKYDKQYVRLRIKYADGTTKDRDWEEVGAKATKKTIDIDWDNYLPAKSVKKVTSVVAQVRGKKDGKYSDAASDSFSVTAPKDPQSVKLTVDRDSDSKKTLKFKYAMHDGHEKTDHDITTYAHLKCRRKYKGDAASTAVEIVNKKTDDRSGTYAVPETHVSQAWDLTDKNMMVEFAMKEQGPGGDSGWKYKKFVFGPPHKPKSLSVYKVGSNWFASWTQNLGKAEFNDYSGSDNWSWNPVDNAKVQYKDGDGSTSWSDCGKTSISSGTGTISMQCEINESGYTIPADTKRIFRVMVGHGDDDEPYLWHAESDEKAYYGSLTSATPSEFTPGDETDENGNVNWPVKWTVNSEVEDAQTCVTVYYNDGSGTVMTYYYDSNITEATIWAPATAEFQITTVATGDVVDKNGNAITTTSDVVDVTTVTLAGFSVARLSETGTDVQATWTLTVDGDWTGVGTELSWANMEDAWESTDQPDTYSITGSAQSWRIAGLEAGETYWFRIRPILNKDEGTYGAYSFYGPVTMSTAPLTPVLTASSPWIEPGDALTWSWTYASDDGSPQTGAVVSVSSSGGSSWELNAVGEEQSVALSSDDTGRVSAGETLTGTVTVYNASTSAGIASESVAVSVVEAPAGTVTCSGVTSVEVETDDDDATIAALTSLPATVTVTRPDENCSASLSVVRLGGGVYETPGGEAQRYAGETAWGCEVEFGDGELAAEVEIPYTARLDDGGSYQLVLTTTSEVTGLSGEATLPFRVLWSHQAVAPTLTAAPDASSLSVALYAINNDASSYASSDVLDIYRVTPSGVQKCGEGLSFETYYLDAYAPYGKSACAYRAVCRTPEGDEAWADVPYSMEASGSTGVTVEWGGESITLPWNLSIDDSYEKDVEVRKHMGGSREAYYNAGVSRTTSISSDIIDVAEDDKVELARALAVYEGPAFIRDRHGLAMACDAQLSLSREHGSAAVAVQLTAKEIDDDSFWVVPA